MQFDKICWLSVNISGTINILNIFSTYFSTNFKVVTEIIIKVLRKKVK